MLPRSRAQEIADAYDADRLAIGCVGSHSGLDIMDGAVEEGLRSIAVLQKGRDATFAKYYKAMRDPAGELLRGCVDEPWVLAKYADVLDASWKKKLRESNCIFVPNRSFTSYCDLTDIEERFDVPMFGSRNMLRSEERGEDRDYYWLLEKAGLPAPEPVADPSAIDGLTIVKLHHAEKRLERGFFTCASPAEFGEKSEKLVEQGVITRDDLAHARMERYVIGPVFNLDFFWSPLNEGAKLELLGVDWRFESSLDGHVRIPATQQLTLPDAQKIPEMTVVGHNSATMRESLLDKAFELGERFVEASQEHFAPGIIGPFALQTCVDKDMRFYIYDVAPRIGGGTNVHAAVGHPYGNMLHRRPMSTGRRIALEVKRAAEAGRLAEVVT